MHKYYLEDYEKREEEEYQRFLKDLKAGKFHLGINKFPSEKRFFNLHKPVALAFFNASHRPNIWSQIPFCGSLVIPLPPFSKNDFEKKLFNISEIPRIIDFIKDTGKLQIVLSRKPKKYQGLDYLRPIFEELNPPILRKFPIDLYVDKKEVKEAADTFDTIGNINFLPFVEHLVLTSRISSQWPMIYESMRDAYMTLKILNPSTAEMIENLMVDNPQDTLILLHTYNLAICMSTTNTFSDLHNFALETLLELEYFPNFLKKQKIRYPCEIGKFLIEKFTYYPEGIGSCNALLDEYDNYDLKKLLENMNDAIISEKSESLIKSSKELNEILDNVWNDKTIPKRITGIKYAIPISMAVIGAMVAGLPLAAGGFLAGLGYDVIGKFISGKEETISAKLAKLRSRNYQINIYDFKKKYNINK